MPNTIKIYGDWTNKRLLRSATSETELVLPPLFQGDILPIQFHLLEPNPAGGSNSFLRPDISNMALKMAIGPDPTGAAGGPALLATMFSFSKALDLQYFYGNLPLNTAEMGTYLGSSASKAAVMEIKVMEGSGASLTVTTVWQGAVILKAQLIEEDADEVPAGQTALSLEMATAMFLKKSSDPGDVITLNGSDGHGVVLSPRVGGGLDTLDF